MNIRWECSMSSFRLLIFDLDDTLVSSAQTWRVAELRVFQELGAEFDVRVAARYKGMNAVDVGRVIYEQLLPPGYTAQQCSHLMRGFLLEEFRKPVQAMPGAEALIRATYGQFPLAVASGSPLEVIREVLAQRGWTNCFRLLVSSESVAHGKPEPDVFLETARQFGCTPGEALVFEDSLNGVSAAKRAGMTCFVTPSSDDPRIPREADCAFSSLADISVATIERYTV